MNLVEIVDKLHSEQACKDYLEKVRWPDGITCPKCGDKRISRIKTRDIYECNNKHQFSLKSGTIFHDSRLPLRTWFLAIHRISESKKGVSANQLSRELGVAYPTAWHMCHRIRESFKDVDKLTLKGIVEADETYVKGKGIPKGEKQKRGRGNQQHTPVLGLKERDGKVKAKAVIDTTIPTIVNYVQESIDEDTEAIYSDAWHSYRALSPLIDHKWVDHSKEYVNGIVHTNNIESFWSLLKRGLIGSYHHVSPKHLQRYLDEFCWRQNQDKDADIFENILKSAVKNPTVRYSELTS